MRSVANDVFRALKALSEDFESAPQLADDQRLYRFVAKQIHNSPHYVLPVSGMIERVPGVPTTVDLAGASCPYSSFTVEFQVSETGLEMVGQADHVVPSYIRFAVIQDLRDPALLKQWVALLAPFITADEAVLYLKGRLMVIPISRVQVPGEDLSPGNRGWTMGWVVGFIDMKQAPFLCGEIAAETGVYERTSIEFKTLAFGMSGMMAWGEMNKVDGNLDHEINRELGLEMLGAVELMVALGNKKFTPKALTGQERCYSVGNPPFQASILIKPASV
ncbi:hypothetical protein [Nevskia ramosa]|uniref:hypothetical protein n=1 Tax=Nevskia ramosa TaxID=64002 RepID=UPI002353C006|nr:hypothetical protein [Nevskia ramosa]